MAHLRIGVFFLGLTPFLASIGAAQNPAAAPDSLVHPFTSREDIEIFLRTAEIKSSRGTPDGITRPIRVTLDDGRIEHDAIFKSIDDRKPGITQLKHGTEYDFKDSWKFEVAAYELDRLLSVNLVPVTVSRSFQGNTGSLQFWIDDSMLESERIEKKINPPNPLRWNWQVYKIRIFDKLIYNIDRNLTNLLVTPDWKCVMIDHSRAFKSVDEVEGIDELKYFSRSLMQSLEELEEEAVRERVGEYLTTAEITAMMSRRDQIVAHYKKLLQEKGNAITYP